MENENIDALWYLQKSDVLSHLVRDLSDFSPWFEVVHTFTKHHAPTVVQQMDQCRIARDSPVSVPPTQLPNARALQWL
jgi:hypothetical protein